LLDRAEGRLNDEGRPLHRLVRPEGLWARPIADAGAPRASQLRAIAAALAA